MKAPQNLESIQRWFSSVITQPLTENQEVQALTIRGNCIKEESVDIIQPSKTMQPFQRIEVYNQQYWWRFYSIMQEQYPLLVRIFGYGDFNKLMVIPFLQAHPTKDWTLRTLGNGLVNWLKKNYTESDRNFVIKCATIDHAFHVGFVKKPLKKANKQISQDQLLNSIYKLQPFVFLLNFDANYLPFRDEFLKNDPEWWVENEFPKLLKNKKYFYLIYRAPDGYMYWEEISKVQFLILKAFKKGASLEEACAIIEDDQSYFDEAIGHIQEWFKSWSELNLFYIRKNNL